MGADDGESKITGQTSTKNNAATANKNNTETCADNSTNENSKASEVQKPDYIHVRARRGQATDSHSLAERVSSNYRIFFFFLRYTNLRKNSMH